MTPADFALTEARDWDMFMCMIGFVGFLVTLLIGLTCWMWRDLKMSFRDRCIERQEHCTREFRSVWKALDDCCPRGLDK